MLLTYFLNDFEMVPVAPIITGITLVFTFIIIFIFYFFLYLLLLLIANGVQTRWQYNSTHLHKNSTQNIENGTYITKRKINWEVRTVPRLWELYPGIWLTTEEKARKTLSYGSQKVPRYPGGSSTVHKWIWI
jgi:hypothetical protein